MFEPNSVASAGSTLHTAVVLIQEDLLPSTGSPTTHLKLSLIKQHCHKKAKKQDQVTFRNNQQSAADEAAAAESVLRKNLIQRTAGD